MDETPRVADRRPRVFVPAQDGLFIAVAPPRCGIAGGLIEAQPDVICIDYEPVEHAQANYGDRVLHAADRHLAHYPTSQRLWVDSTDLIEIGYWDVFEGRVGIHGPDEARVLADWLGLRALDDAELLAGGHHYETKRQIDAMAASGEPRRRFLARWLALHRRD